MGAAAIRPDFRALVRLAADEQFASRAGAQGQINTRVDAIERLRNRDPDAWDLLFTSEISAVYRYARSRIADAAEAEDAAAEVFEQAWEHAHGIEDRGLPARAWLFGIARHVVATRRRRLLARPPLFDIENTSPRSEDSGLSAELIDLAHALEQINRRHAEVVTLRFIHGLSVAECAAALHITTEAVKGRQLRGLAALRSRLAELER